MMLESNLACLGNRVDRAMCMQQRLGNGTSGTCNIYGATVYVLLSSMCSAYQVSCKSVDEVLSCSG